MKFKPALLIGASIIAVLVLAACGGSSPATHPLLQLKQMA